MDFVQSARLLVSLPNLRTFLSLSEFFDRKRIALRCVLLT